MEQAAVNTWTGTWKQGKKRSYSKDTCFFDRKKNCWFFFYAAVNYFSVSSLLLKSGRRFFIIILFKQAGYLLAARNNYERIMRPKPQLQNNAWPLWEFSSIYCICVNHLLVHQLTVSGQHNGCLQQERQVMLSEEYRGGGTELQSHLRT